MSARVEAAAKVLLPYMDDDHFDLTQIASTALEAADQIMFSEAAIERAAKMPWDREMQAPWSSVADGFKQPFINEARAVVAALREEV